MKGNEQVVSVLNQVLRKELTGINQYFIHAKMCENWGYRKLKKVLWDESIGEMKHADRIIERILFLEGMPNVTAYDKISVGLGHSTATVGKRSRFRARRVDRASPGDQDLPRSIRRRLAGAAREYCRRRRKTRRLIETQLHQINEVGYQNYLAQQIEE